VRVTAAIRAPGRPAAIAGDGATAPGRLKAAAREDRRLGATHCVVRPAGAAEDQHREAYGSGLAGAAHDGDALLDGAVDRPDAGDRRRPALRRWSSTERPPLRAKPLPARTTPGGRRLGQRRQWRVTRRGGYRAHAVCRAGAAHHGERVLTDMGLDTVSSIGCCLTGESRLMLDAAGGRDRLYGFGRTGSTSSLRFRQTSRR
jgi:hypothetical protein